MTKKLGIIKGGQLGKMMLPFCMKYDVVPYVLDPDPEAPCRDFCRHFSVGDPSNASDLYAFGKKLDILTIEFENVEVNTLERLKNEGVSVYPDPSIIKLVQDKGLQKKFFSENKIPTAPFYLAENKRDLFSFEKFIPFVQKKRRGGYDGKGVFKIKSRSDLEQGFDEPSVIEKEINFIKEIAVIVARDQAGHKVTFPTVELVFHDNHHLLDYLYTPARVSESINQNAQLLAGEIAEKLKLVGILALEMFVLEDHSLMINEISPRPHNSGHHTLEASPTSQFEQHLRAILGLPLGPTENRSSAVMINLLGEEGYDGQARIVGLEEVLKEKSAYIHLYGKEVTKPFRKMGHLTVLGDNLEETIERAKNLKKRIKIIA